MDNILEQLYHGGVYPNEQIVSTDPEYHSINKTIHKHREYIKQKLPSEDAERMERLEELYEESSAFVCYAAFSYGFKLAVQLMCESFTEDITAKQVKE